MVPGQPWYFVRLKQNAANKRGQAVMWYFVESSTKIDLWAFQNAVSQFP